MQLNPKADGDTIYRVHRILAQRYHPITPDTGNAEMFIRLTAAARILSDPEKRARYDVRYQASKQLQWRILDKPKRCRGSLHGDNGRYTITVQGFDEVETHSMIPAQSNIKLLEPASQRVA